MIHEQMADRLKTPVGRALYTLCKHTVESVSAVIKQVMRFRQVSLRCLENVSVLALASECIA